MPSYVIVGCGGTGYALAEPLLRMLMPLPEVDLWLVDGKDVRSANMARQYGLRDVGRNKAEALADHLNRLKPAGSGPRVTAIGRFFESSSLHAHDEWFGAEDLTLFCCVDSNAARVDIERLIVRRRDVVYLDAGNEEWDGQAVLYQRRRGRALGPLPSEINPELLANDGRLASQIPCDELAIASPQLVVANMGAAWTMLGLWVAHTRAFSGEPPNYAAFDVRIPSVRASRRSALKDA